MIRVLILAFGILMLTACGTKPVPSVIVREHYIFAEPDPSLRGCKPRPGKPAMNDSADEADLIARLDDRGVDCSSRHDRTWESIDDARRRAEEKNRAAE